MKNLLIFLSLFYVASTHSSCPNLSHDITIQNDSTTTVDQALICDGIENAISFFESFGYDNRTYKVSIRVDDQVFVYGFDAVSGKQTDDQYQVFGYYDGSDDSIHISAPNSQYTKGRKAWLAKKGVLTQGLDFDPIFWRSVITHEVSHLILNQLWRETPLNRTLEKNGIPLGSGAHEYIAYSSQISSLPESHRKMLADLYEGQTFEMPQGSILALRHYSFPHLYGFSSFLNFNETYFYKIIKGDLDNDRALTAGIL
jgi:hypothetical protein